jgi:hypothetical protein
MIAMEISPRDFFFSLIDRPEIVHVQNMGDLIAGYEFFPDRISISLSEDENFETYWATIFHELSHRLFCNYQLGQYLLGEGDASAPMRLCWKRSLKWFSPYLSHFSTDSLTGRTFQWS